jgi:restriction system protein
MAAPDGMAARDVVEAVGRTVPLSEHERGSYDGGGRRMDKILRFATIPTVKAGWLVKTKGIWILTDEGRAVFESIADPADLMREASRRYRAWKNAQPVDESGTSAADDIVTIAADNEDVVSTPAATLEEAVETAWDEIESYLRRMPPYEFQELVAALLRAMGYYVPWVAPRGKDGGVDIVAFTDPLGATGPRIKVQVKRVNHGKVGVDGLRSFLAVLGAQDVGLFVTLNGFSSDAELEARAQESRRITLLDLHDLYDLWVEHYEAISEEARSRLPLRPIYFLDLPD